MLQTLSLTAINPARSLAQRHAGQALHRLARYLGHGSRAYDVTFPDAGSAVNRLATLQTGRLIVAIGWPQRRRAGLLVRPCDGRSDRLGGQNHSFDTAWLDRPEEFAALLHARFPAPSAEQPAAAARVA